MESQTWGPVALDVVQMQKNSSLSVFLSPEVHFIIICKIQIYLKENSMLHDSEL